MYPLDVYGKNQTLKESDGKEQKYHTFSNMKIFIKFLDIVLIYVTRAILDNSQM